MSTELTVGRYLQQCRKRSGLSVEAVSTGSRVVPRFVHALEADQHADLPAPVYVRGFIRAYCELAGADVEEALRLYDAEAVPDPPLTVRPAAPAATPTPVRRPWRRVVVGALVVAALGTVAMLSFGRRQPDAAARREGAAPAAPSQPAPPDVSASRANVAIPPPPVSPATPPAAAPPAPLTPPAAPAEGGAPSPPVQAERVLLIRVVETTWVRVTPDGGSPAEETLPPGSVREWRSVKGFRVTTGNAGGILLELDGRPLPGLGERGQMVHLTIPDERRP
jgi:cytoskeleton protein RodZ